MPARQPEYRKSRPHGEFVRGLSDSINDRDGFCDALVASVATRLTLQEVSLAEAMAVMKIPHRAVTALVNLAPAKEGE